LTRLTTTTAMLPAAAEISPGFPPSMAAINPKINAV